MRSPLPVPRLLLQKIKLSKFNFTDVFVATCVLTSSIYSEHAVE